LSRARIAFPVRIVVSKIPMKQKSDSAITRRGATLVSPHEAIENATLVVSDNRIARIEDGAQQVCNPV